jgi:hypothetical protein
MRVDIGVPPHLAFGNRLPDGEQRGAAAAARAGSGLHAPSSSARPVLMSSSPALVFRRQLSEPMVGFLPFTNA